MGKREDVNLMGNRFGSLKKWIKTNCGCMIMLLVLIIFLSITTDTFLTSRNMSNVIRQISTTIYIAAACTMIFIVGGIDLSVSATVAAGAIMATMMCDAGIPFYISGICGILLGAVIGIINGFIIANTKLSPFIVTYAMQSIVRGAVYIITGGVALRITDSAFLSFGNGALFGIPLPIYYLVVIILFVWFVLTCTRFGRHMYSVGGNSTAAAYAGIKIKKIKVFVYTFSGIMAALAGLVLSARNVSGQPTLGTGLEMDAIAAIVLGGSSMDGGLGSVGGTVLGALIIGLLNNGFNLLGLDSYWQYVAKGIVILIAVYADQVRAEKMQKRA